MAVIVKYRPARFGAFGRTLAALSTLAGFRTAVGIPTSTTDNGVPRFDSTAGAMQTSGVTIDDNNVMSGALYRTTLLSIADDAATSFSLPANTTGYGMACGSGTAAAGFFAFRVGSGAAMTLVSGGAVFAVTTGVLAGTTGTDGFTTVSTHTDNKFYVENRLGATVSHGVSLLAR